MIPPCHHLQKLSTEHPVGSRNGRSLGEGEKKPELLPYSRELCLFPTPCKSTHLNWLLFQHEDDLRALFCSARSYMELCAISWTRSHCAWAIAYLSSSAATERQTLLEPFLPADYSQGKTTNWPGENEHLHSFVKPTLEASHQLWCGTEELNRRYWHAKHFKLRQAKELSCSCWGQKV